MAKKILIISTSPRKGGNSERLADEFAAGAAEAGCRVEKVSLRDKSVNFCRGCLACQKTGRCVIRDDAEAILAAMRGADAVVFATPVYFYGMNGQMKTLLDRTNPLFHSEYAFRDVYLLAAAADEDRNAVDGTLAGLNGWLECFGKTRLKGVVFAGGVSDGGDIAKRPEILEEAKNMGRGA